MAGDRVIARVERAAAVVAQGGKVVHERLGVVEQPVPRLDDRDRQVGVFVRIEVSLVESAGGEDGIASHCHVRAHEINKLVALGVVESRWGEAAWSRLTEIVDRVVHRLDRPARPILVDDQSGDSAAGRPLGLEDPDEFLEPGRRGDRVVVDERDDVAGGQAHAGVPGERDVQPVDPRDLGVGQARRIVMRSVLGRSDHDDELQWPIGLPPQGCNAVRQALTAARGHDDDRDGGALVA